ncbi:hypothetical protein [Halanaerobacter jeridensis]|uniref:Serine/threonine protein phosphatase PrpC n=1 Tax=Halanaerobacter jeridensis TaxID=706427 RepID=A0A938XWY7_9FIRM|nr:hypothetical protein [Halanaerobacter jeridensis]MBM7557786.1 hypothetical protein [Halanaerobacter jeridensis]
MNEILKIHLKGGGKEHCEDAPPLYATYKDLALIATFDGMGGSGKQSYKLSNGDCYTGAYLSSRYTKQIISSYFDRNKETLHSLDTNYNNIIDFINSLNFQIKKSLTTYYNEKLTKNRKEFVASYSYKLPTTVSGCFLQNLTNESSKIISFNAGDSMTYLLSPRALVPLTTTVNRLYNTTAGISNFINLSTDFELNIFKVRITKPFIIISCSDGCFDFTGNPVFFEYLIVNNIYKSKSFVNLKRNLKKLFRAKAQDDCSLILYSVGFKKYENLRSIYKSRFLKLKRYANLLIKNNQNYDKLNKIYKKFIEWEKLRLIKQLGGGYYEPGEKFWENKCK